MLFLTVFYIPTYFLKNTLFWLKTLIPYFIYSLIPTWKTFCYYRFSF